MIVQKNFAKQEWEKQKDRKRKLANIGTQMEKKDQS